MHCGQAIAAPRTEQPKGVPAPQYAAVPGYAGAITRPKQNRWIWVLAMALLAIFAGLLGALSMLKTTAKINAPQLAVRGSVQAPPLAIAKPTMPQDVYDWLEHLRKTEDRKNELTLNQMPAIMTEFTLQQGLGGARGAYDNQGNLNLDDLKSPTGAAANTIGDLEQPWRDLIKFFESVPPPDECKDLANTYDSALDETAGEMHDLQTILQGSDASMQANADALQKVTQMTGQSGATIDKHFSLSDDMVAQICDKYRTRKWFSIKADVGSSVAVPSVPSAPTPGTTGTP